MTFKFATLQLDGVSLSYDVKLMPLNLISLISVGLGSEMFAYVICLIYSLYVFAGVRCYQLDTLFMF